MMLPETSKPDIANNGKRKWIYPLVRKGKFYRYRTWLSYFYLGLFFVAPFLRINGNPVLLLNVIERRFVIMGQVFWAQDLFLFVLAMLAFMVFIVLFTISFGRIFCGWICPQTIFMEMVFRKIEEWIEGDAKSRRKLDEGPWTNEKVRKKSFKHVAFFALSFLIANIFLAYIIGSDNLIRIVTEPVSAHRSGLISILLFTIVFYLVYSQVREIVCTVICPYGRLQGVMTDKHTLQVAYNYVRGEPRGKRSRHADQQKGDCVDCSLCIDVCPTGIDIRKGIQLECINCTACIDACDQVMLKIDRPTGLIGFYSGDMIENNVKPAFTTRMAAYSIVMLILLSALGWFIFQRKDVDITILRSAGLLYQEQPQGYISNIYNADVVNKTNRPINARLLAVDPAVKVRYIQPLGNLKKESTAHATFFIMVPASKISKAKTKIQLRVMEGYTTLCATETTFIGPVN